MIFYDLEEFKSQLKDWCYDISSGDGLSERSINDLKDAKEALPKLLGELELMQRVVNQLLKS